MKIKTNRDLVARQQGAGHVYFTALSCHWFVLLFSFVVIGLSKIPDDNFRSFTCLGRKEKEKVDFGFRGGSSYNTRLKIYKPLIFNSPFNCYYCFNRQLYNIYCKYSKGHTLCNLHQIQIPFTRFSRSPALCDIYKLQPQKRLRKRLPQALIGRWGYRYLSVHSVLRDGGPKFLLATL